MRFSAAAGLLLAAGLALSHIPVLAQTPEAGSEAAKELSPSHYVRQAAIGDLFEVESSTLALQKGNGQRVRAFARKMVDDHTQSSQKLKQAAESSGLNEPFPTALDEKHQKMIDRLKSASGEDFDRLYVEMQLEGHQQILKLHTDYGRMGDSKPLQAVALETAPVVQSHVAQLREMRKKP